MLLNPALTSQDGTNPGFSLFNFDNNKEVLHSLEMHYLRIRQTYNWGTELPEITDPAYKFLSVDFKQEYGIKTLASESLFRFMNRLERKGQKEIIKYITDKAGFESEWKNHEDLVIKIYTEDGLIGDDYENVRYICIMSEGLTAEEVRQCQLRKNKEKLEAV